MNSLMAGSLNTIYIEETKNRKDTNTTVPYTEISEIGGEYKKQLYKQELTGIIDNNIKMLNPSELIDFLMELSEKQVNDFIKFLKILKLKINNKIEIFSVKDDEAKGIYINVLFPENESFEKVDEKMDQIYDILDSVNKNLWFVNIGESFYEPEV